MENLETKTNETVEEQVQEEKLTFTKAELDDLIQRKTQEKKNADKVREAEKLARMSAEDKYIYELEQREKLIEQREQELILAENKNECAKILSEKGLSLDLVDFCVDTDAEAMSDRIKRLEKAFKQSVKMEVEKRLGSKEPKQNLPMNETITVEKFKKMSMAEMERLSKEQPELFKELIGDK